METCSTQKNLCNIFKPPELTKRICGGDCSEVACEHGKAQYHQNRMKSLF